MSSPATGINRYSSRSPARSAAGSNATSIWPKGSVNAPPRGMTSDASFDVNALVSAQLYRSAAMRTRGSNRPGAASPALSGKRKA